MKSQHYSVLLVDTQGTHHQVIALASLPMQAKDDALLTLSLRLRLEARVLGVFAGGFLLR